MGIKKEEIAKHFAWYFPSLKQFPEKYLPLIFTDVSKAPEHLAYLCPLCLQNGIFAAKELGLLMSAEFSLDHIVAKSVGGSLVILTCKRCNNNAGREFEPALKKQLERLSFENRIENSALLANTSIKGVQGTYSSQLKVQEPGSYKLDFFTEGKGNAVPLNNWLQNPGTDWEATVTIQQPNKNHLAKSLIKSAYLLCFAVWGYEFVFSHSAEMIRKYLKDEHSYPVTTPIAWFGHTIKQNKINRFPIGICYIQEPVECRSFLVNLLLIDKKSGYRDIASILIPNPTETGWKDLEKLESIFQEVYKNGTPITFSHADHFTLAKGFLNGYSRSWAEPQI